MKTTLFFDTKLILGTGSAEAGYSKRTVPEFKDNSPFKMHTFSSTPAFILCNSSMFTDVHISSMRTHRFFVSDPH